MGTFRTVIELGDPSGLYWEPLEVLVDTGATYTMVSERILTRLGVVPHVAAEFELADGRQVSRDIGRTWIRIAGRAELTLVVFGDAESQPVLGAYALEGFMLAVDPVGGRLVSVPGLL